MITNESDFQQKSNTNTTVKLLLTKFNTVGKLFIGEMFRLYYNYSINLKISIFDFNSQQFPPLS